MTELELLVRLGENIRAARLKKGLSLQEVAAGCRIQKANLSRIESGKTNVSVLTLKKISDCLQTKLHILLPR